ncbi:hypothetical protein [Nakamurella lactea]|jgi:hypothetical protein|uniref:hypothetical protein n=1 Tax=Nakamurella lactea TaxID=459515 RepID=UPI000419B2BB|nr:hypothetical protein [Nakamurella lactea]
MESGRYQADVTGPAGAPAGTHGLPSVVRLPGRERDQVRDDHNGFVTALAVRARRLAGRSVPPSWLDQLEACRTGPAGFGFWPAGERPSWAPDVGGDVDDTAIMTLELWHAGRLSDRAAIRISCLGVAAHRVVRPRQPGPAWIVPGAFATWHRKVGGGQLVDCTVGANALALLATMGLLRLPGCAETVTTIERAVAWAGTSAWRAAAMTPFYSSALEFSLALRHAVSAGCLPLGSVAELADGLAASWGVADPAAPNAVVCSSPYATTTWHSPALQADRAASALPPG